MYLQALDLKIGKLHWKNERDYQNITLRIHTFHQWQCRMKKNSGYQKVWKFIH
jgi:hypothetical protein